LVLPPHETVQDRENKIDGVLMALMDIDVMKRGLDQARLSLDDAVTERDLSADLLDMSGALIVILDPAGRIIAFNHASQRGRATPSGRQRQDVLGLPPPTGRSGRGEIRDCEHPQRRGAREHLRKNLDRQGRLPQGDRLVKHRALWRGRRCQADHQHGIDITPRKLAQDALRRSEDQLRR